MSDTPSLETPEVLPENPYWTTLSEYERDAEYVSRLDEEFYPEAKPERFFEQDGDGAKSLSDVNRRTFLKLGGFAALVASLQGCERPVQKILPYVNQPEEIIPGIPNFYASTCTECASACGLLVKTREGRPIKLEGNPEHPINRGSLCSRGQSGILALYDPERLRFPIKPGRKASAVYSAANTMASLDAEIGAALKSARGKVVLLTSTLSGPSNERLVTEFLKLGPNFSHVVYDPLYSGEERKSLKASFGQEVTPRYRFNKADVVLCLGGDPLGQGVSKVETQQGFAAKRKPTPEGMSRVYAFEPSPTLTGMSADYRYRVRPDALLHVGLAIAHQLIVIDGRTDYASNGAVRQMLAAYSPEIVVAQLGNEVKVEDIARIAKSLAANPGRSIIHTASAAAQTASSMSLHLLANFLNAALGNFGKTIDITTAPSKQALGSYEAMLGLIAEMAAGKIEVLITQGTNPAYTLPVSAGYAAGLAKVKLIVALNLKMDETTALSDVVIPAVHGLESWGDAEPLKGLFSLQQPTINTLFGELSADPNDDTRGWQQSLMSFISAAGSKAFVRTPSSAEISMMLATAGTTDTATLDQTKVLPRTIEWYGFVRETWKSQIFEKGLTSAITFEDFWRSAVRVGVFDVTGEDARNADVKAPKFRDESLPAIKAGEIGKGLVFVANATTSHGDGVSMGNPLLLELPDPVSKVCWDNYAAIAPATATREGLKDGEIVTLTVGRTSAEVPVRIQPGTHPDVLEVHLGWGRNTADGIGHEIGTNAWALASTEGSGVTLSGMPVSYTKTGRSTRLASTQGHNYLYSPSQGGMMVNAQKGDDIPANAQKNDLGKAVYDRPIIAETTFNEWKVNPGVAQPNRYGHNEALPTIWERTHTYKGHKWSMSIDLNACNGCGACHVACSIENNIPVVGKDEIIKGREMFWIRIDRYYRGDKENPDFAQMALLCQHCENAPCETVCPVIATMHNDEGLNVMTYNRCVGTRYCANNCPYKVRRFNFWQYSDYRTGPHDGVKRVTPLELVLNPDVTVRTRGVMEKCSFCVGRIRRAKENARELARPLQDGEMVTACQQTCPAKAIVFGDVNDPNSAVAKDFEDPRGYALLADLNTKPAIRYMALLRNRDEPSPYRNKYQAHRMHESHDGAHTHDNNAGENDHSHDDRTKGSTDPVGHGADAKH